VHGCNFDLSQVFGYKVYIVMWTTMLSLHVLSFGFVFLDFAIICIYIFFHMRLCFTCGPVTDVTEFINLTMAVYI